MSVGIYSAIWRRVFCAWAPRGVLALICCIGIAGAAVQLPEATVHSAQRKAEAQAHLLHFERGDVT
jgi:hypothetical protein